VGAVGFLALLVPVWPVVVGLRGIDSVLHNSFFRNGYELLFVPMDSSTRRRTKTLLDVVCDRLGEAAGSALVQGLVIAGVLTLRPTLLTLTVIIAVAAFWVVPQALASWEPPARPLAKPPARGAWRRRAKSTA